jgi:hypothetical protein
MTLPEKHILVSWDQNMLYIIVCGGTLALYTFVQNHNRLKKVHTEAPIFMVTYSDQSLS